MDFEKYKSRMLEMYADMNDGAFYSVPIPSDEDLIMMYFSYVVFEDMEYEKYKKEN